MNGKNVLVLSGKDHKFTGDIRHFLRSIGLRPIERQGRFSDGVSDPHRALVAAIRAATTIVIILSGDDEARLRQQWYIPDDDSEDKLEVFPQPSLNVLFDAGIVLARHPNKTILVKRGHIRLSKYFEGRRSIELDDTREQRLAFICMLHDIGCEVDLSSDEWLDAGTFGDP